MKKEDSEKGSLYQSIIEEKNNEIERLKVALHYLKYGNGYSIKTYKQAIKQAIKEFKVFWGFVPKYSAGDEEQEQFDKFISKLEKLIEEENK